MQFPNESVPGFWAWIANGALGVALTVLSFIGWKQVNRIDDLEKQAADLRLSLAADVVRREECRNCQQGSAQAQAEAWAQLRAEVKERDDRLFQEFKEFRKTTTAHLEQGRRVMRALELAVKKIDPEAKLNGEGP